MRREQVGKRKTEVAFSIFQLEALIYHALRWCEVRASNTNCTVRYTFSHSKQFSCCASYNPNVVIFPRWKSNTIQIRFKTTEMLTVHKIFHFSSKQTTENCLFFWIEIDFLQQLYFQFNKFNYPKGKHTGFGWRALKFHIR